MPSLPFVTAITNVSADVTTAELQDLSTYGGSVPARDELALYVYLYKRDADNNDTAVTLLNDQPLTANTWQFTLNAVDGLYVAIVFGFPLWSAGSYVTNDCVYYNDLYYIANGATSGEPGVSADWDLITDILSQVLNSGTANTYITQTENFTTARLESGKGGDVLQALGQKIIQGKIKDSGDCADALFFAGLIESAWVNFRRGDSQDAQEIVDWLTGQWAA
jgi:hypothetical protein